MHELAIACELIDVASRTARHHGVARVTRIDCRVGALRQIDPRLLTEAFRIAREETPCAAAELSVRIVAAEAVCLRCGTPYPMRRLEDPCPACGSAGRWVSGGDELELCAIEVEIDDEDRSRTQGSGPQRPGRLPQPPALR